MSAEAGVGGRELSTELRARLKAIKLLVLDVDGVLTDASLYYGPSGEAHKRYHVRDGLGIRILQHFGVRVAIISARKSALVEQRMSDLKIAPWHTGKENKLEALNDVLATCGVTLEQTAYLGDDFLDVPVMRKVAVAVAVADAHAYTREAAHHVTLALGGQGAIRELADAILDAQIGLAQAYEAFLASLYARGAMPPA